MISGKNLQNARLTTTLSHLGALKTMIDGIAQYADQIKLQIDELEPELRYNSSRNAEEPSARLAKIGDLLPHIRNEIAEAIALARPALGTKIEPASSRMRVLRLALSRLERADAELKNVEALKPKSRQEATYLIQMQIALIYFQLGNLLEEGEKELRQALEIYSAMEAVFPKRLVVLFRLARTLDAVGDREQAIAKMREVVHKLKSRSEPTPSNHWIRSTAPRSLGVMLWEEAKARRERSDAGAPVDEATLALFKDAFDFTFEAYNQDVFEDPDSAGALSERTRAANNLIYFLLEYVEAGGVATSSMSSLDIRSLLREIGADDPRKVSQLSAADTARRAYAHLGDHELELEAARAVLRLGSDGGVPKTSVVKDAIRSAERVINASSGGRDPRLLEKGN